MSVSICSRIFVPSRTLPASVKSWASSPIKSERQRGDVAGKLARARAIADALSDIVLPDLADLNDRFARQGGVGNLACAGETSWYGFARAIIEGLNSRGGKLQVETIVPIAAADFPTKAKRRCNSCHA